MQIGRINAAGAGAIIKMGQGGSTVTAAKNIKQLGLDKLILLASIDDGATLQAARRNPGRPLPVRCAAACRLPDAIPPVRPARRPRASSRSGGESTATATPMRQRAPGTR